MGKVFKVAIWNLLCCMKGMMGGLYALYISFQEILQTKLFCAPNYNYSLPTNHQYINLKKKDYVKVSF